MEPSKITINYFRKKLRQQKRRTVFMFFVGLILGGAIVFNVYYWYPLLQKQFDLPTVKQFGNANKPSPKKVEASTTKPSTKETTQTTEKKEKTFKPRTDVASFTKVDPKYEALNKQLNQTVESFNTTGTVLAVKNNQVVLLNNYGNAAEANNDPVNSKYMLASIQKMVTGLLVMKLIEEGKITLNTTLSNYYPSIPNSQNITVDQMLTMTSGLFLKEKLADSTSKEESIDYVVKNVTYQPLDKWHYSDVNFFLLAAIVEKVTNMSYEDYFAQVIGTPLNLENTGFYDVSNVPEGMIASHKYNESGELDPKPVEFSESNVINELGTGNMYTSAGDLLTIIQGMLDGKIVSKKVLTDSLAQRPASVYYDYKAGFYDKGSHYYGHGVFRSYEPTIVFSKDGNNAVVVMSNAFTENKANVNLANQLFTDINQ